MKGQKFVFIAMLIALVVAIGAFTSVMAADDNTFRVVNNTNRDVSVEVYSRADIPYGTSDTDDSGVQKIFNVAANSSNDVLLDEDEVYYYAYLACGDVIDGSINMKDDVEIVIPACDRKPTILWVRNHLGSTTTLALIQGDDEDTYDIEPGLTKLSVAAGDTFYSYDACFPLQDFNGEIHILDNGKSQLIMRSCEYYASPVAEFGAQNVVSFRIINHASFPIILTIIGPMNDLIEITPGENRVTLVAGSYSYSYYMDFNVIAANFFVSPNGNGILLLSPEYTIDYGLVEEEEFE